MADVFTKRQRSAIMKRVHGRGNKATEVALTKLFRRHGITGWRRHKRVFGKPDFIFPEIKFAVFVDGCFWHVCPWHSSIPLNNRRFWMRKLDANRQRDALVSRTLRERGWYVLRLWGHEFSKKNEVRLLERIRHAMQRAKVVSCRTPPKLGAPAGFAK